MPQSAFRALMARAARLGETVAGMPDCLSYTIKRRNLFMLEFNNNKNLLMQARYQYELQDVEEPNLYRDIFDYQSIPKVPFNMRTVPMDMPEEIWMTDTTFRDGQQSVSPFTVDQIVHLFKLQRVCVCGY